MTDITTNNTVAAIVTDITTAIAAAEKAVGDLLFPVAFSHLEKGGVKRARGQRPTMSGARALAGKAESLGAARVSVYRDLWGWCHVVCWWTEKGEEVDIAEYQL